MRVREYLTRTNKPLTVDTFGRRFWPISKNLSYCYVFFVFEVGNFESGVNLVRFWWVFCFFQSETGQIGNQIFFLTPDLDSSFLWTLNIILSWCKWRFLKLEKFFNGAKHILGHHGPIWPFLDSFWTWFVVLQQRQPDTVISAVVSMQKSAWIKILSRRTILSWTLGRAVISDGPNLPNHISTHI